MEFLATKFFSRLISSSPICISLIIFSCNNDNEGNPFAGKYQISNVIVSQDVVLGSTGYIISQGTNVTNETVSFLFASAICSSLSMSALELKENGDLYIFCTDGTSAIINGNWSRDSPTQITLNLAIPTAFSLVLTGISFSGKTILGKTNELPLTKSIYSFLLPGVDTSGPEFPLALLLNTYITMTKI